MEIRTLKYFLAVAREENMTRAAEILHVTQPTLSKQLKALEDELGKKLFTRHSFSIKLTDKGILLKNRAEDLVGMADKIEKEFVALDDVTGGDLYLGLAESYQISLLVREINTFKKSYPGLRYHITSGDTEQVAEKLDKGLLDFAVLAETPDLSKYESLVFPESDIWGVVMPADSALAKKRPSVWMTLSVYHYFVQVKVGKRIYQDGLRTKWISYISKALSAYPIMHRFSQRNISATFSPLISW